MLNSSPSSFEAKIPLLSISLPRHACMYTPFTCLVNKMAQAIYLSNSKTLCIQIGLEVLAE